MNRCDDYQDLLLDHLYGLLDPAEADALSAHLADCPACAAARDRTARDQRLFAQAAKQSFPQVRFAPPPAEPVATPAGGSAGRGRGWSWATAAGWAVAAGLAIAPAAWVVARLAQADAALVAARRDGGGAVVHREAAAPAVARQSAFDPGKELADATREYQAVAQEWREAWQKALAAEAGRPLSVDVTGPTAVQPGAPNEFTVVVHGGAAPGVRVEAQVRDAADRVLLRQSLDHERNGDTHAVKLPADLWTKVTADADLSLVVATVDDKTGLRTEVQDRFRLTGPVLAAHLATDKPLYRPGDRLFFRSETLDRTTFRPPDRDQTLRYELADATGKPVPGLTLTGRAEPVRATPDGFAVVDGPDGKPIRGVGGGAFDLPPALPPGDYTLTVSEVPHPAKYAPMPPASRTVAVRPFAPERFHKEVGFAGASFNGGDTVSGWCRVADATGPVAGAAVVPTVTVGGRRVGLPPVTTEADGRAAFRFTLPAAVEGDVTVRAVVEADGATEAVTRPVPVAGRRVKVEFFPEGGDLIAGVPNRVYLRATDAASGRPADVRGTVTDGRKAIARVETFTDPDHPGANRGLGAFTFTPEVGTTYALAVDRPVAAVPAAVVGGFGAAAPVAKFPLPKTKSDGVVMTVPGGVAKAGEPVVVHVRSVGMQRELVVGAFTRGRLVDTKTVTVAPGRPEEVRLDGGDPRGGVTRVTVFRRPPDAADGRADLEPVAERLVYRVPGETLKLDAELTPLGGEAELRVRAADENGKPAAAVVYAAVVNDAAVAPADGKRDRLLSTHFLLAGEVQKPDDLEHVDFLLSPGPKAAEALDLLLGTQGWRRFAEQTGAQFASRQKLGRDDAARLVMLNGQGRGPIETPAGQEQRKVYAEYAPRYEAAVRRLDQARRPKPAAARAEVVAAPPAVPDTGREARASAVVEAARAAAEVRGRTRFGAWAAGAVAVVLVLAAVARRRRRVPFAAGGLLAGVIAAVLAVVSVGSPEGTVDTAGAAAPPAVVIVDNRPAAAPAISAGSEKPVGEPKPAPAVSAPLGKAAPSVSSKAAAAPLAATLPKPTGEKDKGRLPAGPAAKKTPAAAAPGASGGGAGLESMSAPAAPTPPPAPATPPPPALDAAPYAMVPPGTIGDTLRRAAGGRDAPQEFEADAGRRLSARGLQADRSFHKRLDPAVDQPAPARPAAPPAVALGGLPAEFRNRAPVSRTAPLVVREFANPPAAPDAVPPDTVLWKPVVVLPADGTATFRFRPDGDATAYQVIVAGHTLDGRIGAVRRVIPVAPGGAK